MGQPSEDDAGSMRPHHRAPGTGRIHPEGGWVEPPDPESLHQLLARVQRLALLEDRERIARDLHDTVIRKLFAAGLSLQGIASLCRTDPDTAMERINLVVEDLDTTVRDIRSTVFDLEGRESFPDL